MSLLGNILWIVLGGGIFIFFEYLFGGVFLCITVIGIPFGVQCFKLAILGLLPFGRTVAEREPGASTGCINLGLNIIWIIVFGFAICLTHLFFALLCAVTIIGIPFAVQHIKLAGLALLPFGRDIVEA